MGSNDITVAMPTIPPRVCGNLFRTALDSARKQTLPPRGGISVALDVDHVGAAATRQRALDAVHTTWVAFLDDDDFWYPDHLNVLMNLAQETGADYVWSWFAGNNPFPTHRGRQMDIHNPHHTTMTVMVKTELAKAAGFYNHPDANNNWPGEDWNFTLQCIKILRKRHGDEVAATKFAGTSEVTWHYRVHDGNTSGLPTRW